MKEAQEFNSDYAHPFLTDARRWLPQAAASKEGAICPCCGEFNKVYHRKIPLSTIQSLFRLYKLNENMAGAYHSRDFTGSHSGGDFAKIAALGLFSKELNEDTQKNCSGYWYITEAGKQFCRGTLNIREKLVIYHNELIDTEGEFKLIHEFWSGFDYGEMMNDDGRIQ
jgi:hypothetical protein